MIVLSIAATTVSFAQHIFTGTVIDQATGEPLLGATVREAGNTKSGAMTNDKGQFQLTLKNKRARLIVTYIGYERKELEVTNDQTLTIPLNLNDNTLGEAVVTGYGGTTVRSKLVNSISKVDNSTISSTMVSNVGQALSGAIAGVRVVQSSGNPNATPSIILRGGTDYNGSGTPLIVVDGMIRASMNDVNPNDIESLEVMKDAGATAIYGSRANNGVILITTKKGKNGEGRINFSSKLSWNYFNNPYNFVDAGDYLYWMRTAYKRGEERGYVNTASLSGTQPYGTGNDYAADGNKSSKGLWGVYLLESLSADTKKELLAKGWQTMKDPVTGKDLIYVNNKMEDYNLNTPSFSQDYNVNFSGGNDRGHYYAGLGYNRSEGNALDNYNERLSLLFNTDYKVKPWLTSFSTLNFSTTKYQDLPLTSSNEANYFSRVFSYPPTFRLTNNDGEYILGVNAGDGNQQVNINNYWRDYSRQKLAFSQSLVFDLTKGLTFNVKGDWFYEYYTYEYFYKTYQTGVNSYNTKHNSLAQHERELTSTYNAILNYQTDFGAHHFNAMAGWEYWSKKGFEFYAAGYNTNNNYFPDLEYTITDEGARSMDSEHATLVTKSLFARVNYDYADKYLASFTIRRDGISKLDRKQRWGTFPGLSLGWAFYKEDFMKRYDDWLSFGKLRTSFGLNGNVNANYVGNYTVQGSYASTQYNGILGYYLNNVPNPYLTWETSRTLEVGLDLGFFNNRLQSSFTVYDRRTYDKYANITIPASSGYTSVTSNNGTLQNRGLEVELKYHILRTKDWKVYGALNLAYNKNTVIKLPKNSYDNNRQDGFQVYTGQGDKLQWVGGYAEGETPGDLYVYYAEGFYNSVDEIPANLVDKTTAKWLYGPEAYKAADPKKSLPIKPGDVRWRDVNNDGVIDTYDRVKVGNTSPKWTGGLNLSASWRGLTLSTRLDFALGHWIYDTKTTWLMGCMQGTYNMIDAVKDTWTPENTNAKYPIYTWADQLGPGNYNRASSIFAYRGDYLAFRDISLAYALPERWAQRIGLQKLELSVSGQNLGYLSAAPYVHTPEMAGSNNGGYPLPQMLVLGVNVTL